ncbi:histidine kinase [Actinoplanes sp. NEAU-A12]|uniref:histidine kinase n=1 Tax=Actinoplanes sandaracinus TaxID=3045177 RepID=A0ABT6WBA9_9ACTN|nr:histidine kinase [Actinoplanes sandaracinus]MDI6097015.1 histidine kinase [Actinoplanes sandaracinus]
MRRPTESSRRHIAWDIALAVSVAGTDTWLAIRHWHLDTGYGRALLVVQAIVQLGLVLRRRAPEAVLGAIGVVALLQLIPQLVVPGFIWAVDVDPVWVVTPVGSAYAIYATLVYGHRRRLGWVLVTGVTLLAVRPWQPHVTVVTLGLVMTVMPALLGMWVASRRKLLRALAERVERAEREQHLLAVQARAEERARLAREMHDVVTHRVTLMVLQAGALGVSATDEGTRQAAEELRTAGCQALEELRDLVRVLRSPAGEDGAVHREPSPVALPDLSELVEQSRSVGVPVEVVQEGVPVAVAPVVGRTAYRLVQEALTNVRKHAPGAAVRVELGYSADRIRLSVTDTGSRRASDPVLATAGSGSGLIGLRQRVELVHGELTTGPRPDGGYRVAATLPVCVPTEGIL